MSRAPIDEEELSRESTADAELSKAFQSLIFGRSWSGGEHNCCFLNTRQGNFANVSAVSGLDFIDDGRGVAITDWDHDGDPDLWLANRTGPRLRLMRNNLPSDRHFVSVQLQGNGTTSNRDAIGGRVEINLKDAGDTRLVKSLSAGGGFLSQSSKRLTFGLGESDVVESVELTWPDGESQRFTDIEVDKHYTLVQGQAAADRWARPEAADSLTTEAIAATGDATSRTVLAAPSPAPQLHYTNFQGKRRLVQNSTASGALVNLWASWCVPCLKELTDFGKHAEQIREWDLDIIAISVDGVGDNRSVPADELAAVIERCKFPFKAGVADADLLARVQHVHDRTFVWHERLPVPMSLLLDAGGNVVAIYKGPVSIEQLEADVNLLSASNAERQQSAAMLAGQWIGEPPVRSVRSIAHGFVDDGFLEDAELLFRRILRAEPDDPEAHYDLAVALQRLRRFTSAAEAYRSSLKLHRDHRAHSNLAMVLEELDDVDAAIQQYELAIELADRNPQIHVNLALLFGRQQRFDKALGHLLTALEIQPDNTETRFLLGNTLSELGRYTDAITEYRKAIEDYPRDAALRNRLGLALFQDGKIGEAVDEFQSALRIDPNYEPARMNLDRARSADRP